jgi:hypothetical protein
MRIEEVHTDLLSRLLARLPEIEQAALTRVYSVSDPAEASDPEYAEGLPAAVAAGFEYGLAGIKRGEERSPEIPSALLTQARLAARNHVSLDTVLRRYFAGYTLLGDFLVEEAEAAGLHGGPLKSLLRIQASRFDSLVATIADEYVRASPATPTSAEERRAELVQRLLDGELLDAAELSYDFDFSHLGVVAAGPGAAEAVRDLTASLDVRLLLVCREDQTVWAWLGGRHAADLEQLELAVSRRWPAGPSLAIGEPAGGLAGWRFTHQQARAALPIALRSAQALTRYADVALLASMLQDDLLATSLRRLYLAPLSEEWAGGVSARETLRAYFAAGRNVSSAAAALGVKRHTVTNRLRAVEERIGRPLSACAAEVEAVLRLQDMGVPPYDTQPLSTPEPARIDPQTRPVLGSAPGHIGRASG